MLETTFKEIHQEAIAQAPRPGIFQWTTMQLISLYLIHDILKSMCFSKIAANNFLLKIHEIKPDPINRQALRQHTQYEQDGALHLFGQQVRAFFITTFQGNGLNGEVRLLTYKVSTDNTHEIILLEIFKRYCALEQVTTIRIKIAIRNTVSTYLQNALGAFIHVYIEGKNNNLSIFCVFCHLLIPFSVICFIQFIYGYIQLKYQPVST